jgi:hypothetical protein
VARQEGLEPPTYGLEGRCSIQLSYCRIRSGYSMFKQAAIRTCNPQLRRPVLYPVELRADRVGLTPKETVVKTRQQKIGRGGEI